MSGGTTPRIGTDLVDVGRLTRAVRRREAAWRRRVFTEAEWQYAASRADRDVVLAARFAAKEAVMKALGTGWGGGVQWLDIEVQGGGRSEPRLVLRGEARRRANAAGLTFQLSISHAGDLAIATVLGWPGPSPDRSP